MTAQEFKKWLNTMPAGTKTVYFTGSLMFARKFSKDLDRLAEAVWNAAGMRWIPNARPTAEKGHTDQWCSSGERRVVLTQRRLSEPLGYEYIVTKV